MFQTIEQEEQVRPRLARVFFVVYTLVGLVGIVAELHRHGLSRLGRFPVSAIIFGLSIWWSIRKTSYSKRQFQLRAGALLLLIGISCLLQM
jgi:hypothetical protein